MSQSKPRHKPHREALYHELRRRGPLTMEEIEAVLVEAGVSRSNVRRDNVNGLLANGSLKRIANGTGGRELFGFGDPLGTVLAIVGSTTRVRVHLLDANLDSVADVQMEDVDSLVMALTGETPEQAMREFTKKIADTVERLYEEHPKLLATPPKGIGVALPVAVDQVTGQVTDSLAGGFDVSRYLGQIWTSSSLPLNRNRIVWATDIAAAALGYIKNHPDFEARNVLAVKASAWIRHAFIVDGRVVRGASNRGHAFGRLRSPAPRKTKDEVLAVANPLEMIEAEVKQAAAVLDDHASLLGIRAWMDAGKADTGKSVKAWAAEYIEGVRSNGRAHRYSAQHAGASLGAAIGDALCLLDPEAVLLTGHMVSELGDEFAAAVKRDANLAGRILVHRVDEEVRKAKKSSTVTGIGSMAAEQFLFCKAPEHLALFDSAKGRR